MTKILFVFRVTFSIFAIMICNECKADKDVSDFYKDAKHPGGYKKRCKFCINTYIKNSPKVKERFLKKKAEIYAKHKAYRATVKDRISLKKREWASANRERIRETDKAWREKNKDHYTQRAKIYREKNKDRLREAQREWAAKRKQEDEWFRIACKLRSHLASIMRRKGGGTNVIPFISCSVSELRKHLESQFKEGMSWGNYGRGGWHVDHVNPVKLFDLTIPEEQIKCFHYTNLQPMWWKENLDKRQKYNGTNSNTVI